MEVIYSFENLYEIREEIAPLHKEHFSNDYRASVNNLNMDWDMYKELFSAGMASACIARVCGAIVGYLVFHKVPDLHTKGKILGVLDGLFVLDEYRSNGIAKELIHNAEEDLIKSEAYSISMGFRDEESANRTVGKLGYSKAEVNYIKILRGE